MVIAIIYVGLDCIIDNGKEILSMNEVIQYLLRSSGKLLEESELPELLKYEKHDWSDLVDKVRGMIVTFPGMVCPHRYL